MADFIPVLCILFLGGLLAYANTSHMAEVNALEEKLIICTQQEKL